MPADLVKTITFVFLEWLLDCHWTLLLFFTCYKGLQTLTIFNINPFVTNAPFLYPLKEKVHSERKGKVTSFQLCR